MKSLIGREIPEFTLSAYRQGEIIEVTKQDVLGKWSLFFFYPADFTFVCPTELSDLADAYNAFQEIGCEIYAASSDSAFAHKAWADASESIRKIPYPMLSDPAGSLAKFFGVWLRDAGQALRGAFIVDPKGRIKAYEVNDLGIGRNAEEILRKLSAAQFVAEHGDQVCPARWKPGAKTLTPSLDLVGKL